MTSTATEISALFRPGFLGLCVVLLAGCGQRDQPAHSVVLITLDTTRADALGPYGADHGLTPNLDALAQESLVYDHAYTVAPLTLPAHASLMTGLYPPRHTMRDNGLGPLPRAADTLAELARDRGVETAAFVGSLVLDDSFGLDQGFEVYESPEEVEASKKGRFVELPAEDVIRPALEWLRGRDRRRRFFLWVHLFDPHAPYEPPRNVMAPTPYLGEIATVDRALGALLEALQVDGALQETVVLLAGDHGESLGEHGEPTHGTLCYEATLRVPLMLRYPDGHRAGERSDSIVSLVDVFPTLIEAMGLSQVGGGDGLSLFRRRVPLDRGVYFESMNGYLTFGWSPLSGWIDRKGKYLHSSRPEYYVVREDSLEEQDRVNERDLEAYRVAIRSVAERPRLDQDLASGFDASVLASMKALGYASGYRSSKQVPDPLSQSGAPNPADRVAELKRSLEALEMLNRGELEEAERIFQEVLDKNSKNAFALDGLASSRMRMGRSQDAIEPLMTLLENGPAWPTSHFNLGVCLRSAGRHSEAVSAFLKAVELRPDQAQFLEGLVDLLEERGHAAQAKPFKQRLAGLGSAQ